jgi:hypothetical protein
MEVMDNKKTCPIVLGILLPNGSKIQAIIPILKKAAKKGGNENKAILNIVGPTAQLNETHIAPKKVNSV